MKGMGRAPEMLMNKHSNNYRYSCLSGIASKLLTCESAVTLCTRCSKANVTAYIDMHKLDVSSTNMFGQAYVYVCLYTNKYTICTCICACYFLQGV